MARGKANWWNLAVMLKRLVAGVIILAVLALVTQSTILPGMVERILRNSLREAGLPARNLTIRAISWSSADFTDVVLGAGSEIRLDSLRADYDWHALLAGRVRAIRISGAQITVNLDQQEWRQTPQHLQRAGQSILQPRHDIEITSGSILLLKDGNRWRIPLEGRIAHPDGAVQASGSMELLGGHIAATAECHLPDGTRRIQIDLAGINPALLPLNLLAGGSALFPVQGTINGTLTLEKAKDVPWRMQTDLSFRLFGSYRAVPFQLNQGRLEFESHFSFWPFALHDLTGDFAAEETQLDRYAVKNLAVRLASSQETLQADIIGSGVNWAFESARVTLDGPNRLLALWLGGAPPPSLRLELQGFHHSFPGLNVAVQNALLEAQLLRAGTAGLRLHNPDIQIDNGTVSGDAVFADGIKARLSLSEFMPLALRNVQQIEAAELRMGDIQLQNGVVHLQETDGVISVDRCDWNWCGGRLSCRPFPLQLDRPESRCLVFFEGVWLDRFLQTVLPGKIRGEGRLFGRIPAKLRHDPDWGIILGQGHLYTVPAYGTLSILDDQIISAMLLGEEPDEQNINTTTNAWRSNLRGGLENYEYALLKITFSPRVPNALQGEIQLRGQVENEGNELRLGLTIPFPAQ